MAAGNVTTALQANCVIGNRTFLTMPCICQMVFIRYVVCACI